MLGVRLAEIPKSWNREFQRDSDNFYLFADANIDVQTSPLIFKKVR